MKGKRNVVPHSWTPQGIHQLNLGLETSLQQLPEKSNSSLKVLYTCQERGNEKVTDSQGKQSIPSTHKTNSM